MASRALSKAYKEKILRALEEDREFRYAVAGLIGIREVLERLDGIEKNQERIWQEIKGLREEQVRAWQEMGKTKEEIVKLWQEVRGLREEQVKIWQEMEKTREEIKGLREEQARTWREIEKTWREIEGLREEQAKTWREIEKLWEEIKGLREEQARTWREIEKTWREIEGLREEQAKTWREIEKLWEEVRELRRGQEKLWTEVRGLRTSFEQLGRSVGMTLDHYAAAFIKELLIERGYPEAVKVEAEVKLKDPKSKRTWEIDVFCENPLVVGEVTTTVGTAEEAEAEVSKLLERVSFVKELYGEEVQLKLLVVANASAEAKERLRALAQRHDLTVLVGRELSEL